MKRLFALAIFLAVTPFISCSWLGGIPLNIPAIGINCALPAVTELAVSLIDDVNTCIGEGRQQFCDQPTPENPTETKCSWKKCVWDLAKKQGKQHGVEAVLCAVDQAGVDFQSSFAATGDQELEDSANRAEEFITESGAKFEHSASD